MYVDKETREELTALSKEVFGSTTKWKKILDEGTIELVTRKTTQKVKNAAGIEEDQEITVPVLMNGVRQFTSKYFTLETLKEFMLDLKVKRDEFVKMIEEQQKAQKEAAEKAKLAESINSDAGGSAL